MLHNPLMILTLQSEGHLTGNVSVYEVDEVRARVIFWRDGVKVYDEVMPTPLAMYEAFVRVGWSPDQFVQAHEGWTKALARHLQADGLAQRVLGEVEPWPGESPDEYKERLEREEATFRRLHPEWRPDTFKGHIA